MSASGVPWACVGCGVLAIHRGRGRTPERCADCKLKHKAARARAVRAGSPPGQVLLADTPPDRLDREPSKVEAASPRSTALPGNQWSRRGKVPVDLTGCPDPDLDLPAARIWVMRHVFGVDLYSWQKREMYAVGCRPRPKQAYVQLGRKNGKSLFGCALILTELILVPGSAVYAVSDSERNLNSAMVRELKTLIARSPQADAAFVVTTGAVEYPHNGSFFEVRPNKFAATQSINPTLVVMDEVHLQRSDEMWNGFVLSDPGGGDFLLLGITTPGYDLTSFAHDLYLRVKAGDPTLYGRIFEPADLTCSLDDRGAWIQSNPRLEDAPEFMAVLESQLTAGMPEHEFRRFRLGIWTATASAWLPHGAWDSRSTGRTLTPADLDPEVDAWLAFDGSFSGDSTALVVGVGTHLSVVAAWENPGSKGWRVPRAEVDAVVSLWMNTHRRVRLLADPPYWQRELSDWSLRWPGRVIEFPTHVRARMAPACTRFYAAVMDGTLTHDGDKRLARHVSNAVVKASPEGDYITKPDPNSPAKIDLAVAAVVAFSASSQAVAERGPAVIRRRAG